MWHFALKALEKKQNEFVVSKNLNHPPAMV